MIKFDNETLFFSQFNLWDGISIQTFLCSNLFLAVSETPECPDGYQLFGEACYKAFDEAKNYSSAEAFCATDGGIVAEPRNRAVNNFLITLKTSLNPYVRFWLGLTDRKKEGTWRWNADGEKLDGNSFTNWAEGEPNQAGNEDCAVVEVNSKWNDVPCRLKYRFICERPAYGKKCVTGMNHASYS